MINVIYLKKTLCFSIVWSECNNEYEKKIFKEKESIEILKIIDLIANIEVS